MSVSAYPLQWPAMRPRRPRYQVGFSRFDRDRSIAQAREFLLNELERLGANGIVISSNIQLRNDGLPRSGQPQPSDPAVAVWFTLKGQPTCLSCDAWNQGKGRRCLKPVFVRGNAKPYRYKLGERKLPRTSFWIKREGLC